MLPDSFCPRTKNVSECNPFLPSAGCDKPRFNEERRVSEDTVGKTIKETDSSVMEEVGEVELQVSRGSLIGDQKLS